MSNDCTCGQPHHDGANYYVSAIDAGRTALLAGPFTAHSEALAIVEPARKLACKLDGRAWFYGFGTVAMPADYTKPGKLNQQLNIEKGIV